MKSDYFKNGPLFDLIFTWELILDTYRGLGYAQFGWSIFLNRRWLLKQCDKENITQSISFCTGIWRSSQHQLTGRGCTGCSPSVSFSGRESLSWSQKNVFFPAFASCLYPYPSFWIFWTVLPRFSCCGLMQLLRFHFPNQQQLKIRLCFWLLD